MCSCFHQRLATKCIIQNHEQSEELIVRIEFFPFWTEDSGSSVTYLICNLNMISHKHMPAFVIHHILMNFLPHSSSMKYPVCYLCDVSSVTCLKNLWLPVQQKKILHEVDQIICSAQKKNKRLLVNRRGSFATKYTCSEH